MGPPVPPPKRAFSSDNLTAVSLQDAAESRARAALRIADDERQRADDAEERAAELESALARVKSAHVAAEQDRAVSAQEHGVTVTADALTVQRSGRKFVIPFTLVSILAPLIWTGVADYLEMKRQAKEQKDTFASTTLRIDKLEQKLAEQARESASLRETVAQLSGYLAGVLPKAGVTVPGLAPGAIPVNVVSDPLPLGTRRPTPVNVRTQVPAPSTRAP